MERMHKRNLLLLLRCWMFLYDLINCVNIEDTILLDTTYCTWPKNYVTCFFTQHTEFPAAIELVFVTAETLKLIEISFLLWQLIIIIIIYYYIFCLLILRTVYSWYIVENSRKILFPSIFDTSLSSLMMWNLQCYPTTVLNERMWHFRGLNILWLSYIFSGSQNPQPPGSTPMVEDINFLKCTYIDFPGYVHF